MRTPESHCRGQLRLLWILFLPPLLSIAALSPLQAGGESPRSRGYLAAIGSPPLRFAESVEPPAPSPPRPLSPEASGTDAAEAKPIDSPATTPPPAEPPASLGPPETSVSPESSSIPAEPALPRAEEILPFFQLPGRGAPASGQPFELPRSSAVYQQK